MSKLLDITFNAIGIGEDKAAQRNVMALLARAGVPLDVPATSAEVPAENMPAVILPTLAIADPNAIKVDAATYQFRSMGDDNGVTHDGRYDAKEWNPILHGDPILVHERLDGALYVVDGHHRLDLAKRLKAEGHGPEKVAIEVLREADGYTPEDMKIIGAYKNIAHGNANLLDAAHAFKEAEYVHKQLLPELPADKGNLAAARTLATLSDDALKCLEDHHLAPELGVEVAKSIKPEQQSAVMRVLAEKPSCKSHCDAVKARRDQRPSTPSIA